MTEKKSVNVYDFDGTIYQGDSSIDFWKFCARRHPKTLMNLPTFGISYIKYLFGRCDKTELKESFFSFLRYLSNVDADISLFWDNHYSKIHSWYLPERDDSDVIISASPDFLLNPVAERFGVSLIASRVDKMSGKFSGKNCKGEEKVRRFSVEFPDVRISRFYSDSLSDSPLAVLSDEAYLISDDSILPWCKSVHGENPSSKFSISRKE